MATTDGPRRLRSQAWFDDPADPGMTALYVERYLNWGLTREELQSGRPVIGIAQTGSDLSPCNRHHLQLADRVREGIRARGGLPLEFPVHPIQETGRRPTAAATCAGSKVGSGRTEPSACRAPVAMPAVISVAALPMSICPTAIR